jgi:hypothetical protein
MRDTRNGFVALLALMVQYLTANETGQTAGARFDPLLQLRASIPEISKCRQLLVVTTERVFEKSHAGAIRFRIRRIEARSIIVSEVCTRYS